MLWVPTFVCLMIGRLFLILFVRISQTSDTADMCGFAVTAESKFTEW